MHRGQEINYQATAKDKSDLATLHEQLISLQKKNRYQP